MTTEAKPTHVRDMHFGEGEGDFDLLTRDPLHVMEKILMDYHIEKCTPCRKRLRAYLKATGRTYEPLVGKTKKAAKTGEAPSS